MSIDLSGLVHKKTEIEIGTEKFTFTELTLADMAEFRAHVRKDRQKINEERRARLMIDAEKIGNINPVELLKLTDTSMSEEEFQQQSETLEGIGYLAYLSLRHSHIGISAEQVQKIITPTILDEVTDALFPPTPEAEEVKKKLIQTKKKLSQK